MDDAEIPRECESCGKKFEVNDRIMQVWKVYHVGVHHTSAALQYREWVHITCPTTT